MRGRREGIKQQLARGRVLVGAGFKACHRNVMGGQRSAQAPICTRAMHTLWTAVGLIFQERQLARFTMPIAKQQGRLLQACLSIS